MGGPPEPLRYARALMSRDATSCGVGRRGVAVPAGGPPGPLRLAAAVTSRVISGREEPASRWWSCRQRRRGRQRDENATTTAHDDEDGGCACIIGILERTKGARDSYRTTPVMMMS